MEYRREPRFEANQPVDVTDLDHDSCVFPGELVNFSSQGVRLLLARAMDPGTAVKVQWAGTMLLGEVIYCIARANGFHTGLNLVDALYDTDALAGLEAEYPLHQPGLSGP